MWVLIALASLVTLIILLLCIPLDTTFRVDVYGRPQFNIRLNWLFGLVTKEIAKGKKQPKEKKRRGEDKRKLRRRWSGVSGTLKILRIKGLWGKFKGLFKDVLGCLRIKDFRMDFRAGFDDPADTGLLFAIIEPVMLFLGGYFSHQISLQPSFEGEVVLEGYCYGTLRLQPIRLSIPLLRFIFSLAAIRAIKMLVLMKWKRKK